MATMKDFVQQLIDKIERQARRLALAEAERDRCEKLAATWEERALAAEGKLESQVDWEAAAEHNFEAYKQEQQRVIALEAKLEQAEALLLRCNDVSQAGFGATDEEQEQTAREIRAYLSATEIR